MNRNIFVVGVVVLIIGIVLTLAFWPLFGVRASTLEEDRDGMIYESYSRDDKITIYGRITNMGETPNFLEDLGLSNVVYIELDDSFEFVLTGDEIDFSEGDSIYGSFILRRTLGFEYWELSGSLGNKQVIDIVFYIVTGSGLVITVAGYVKI